MDIDQSEITSIRELLGSKPRPVGWAERRQRLDEIGAVWPVAEDVSLSAADCGGVPGEWSIVPESNPSCVLMYLHGGGSGDICAVWASRLRESRSGVTAPAAALRWL